MFYCGVVASDGGGGVNIFLCLDHSLWLFSNSKTKANIVHFSLNGHASTVASAGDSGIPSRNTDPFLLLPLSRLALPAQRDAGKQGWTETITERCLIQ